MASAAAIKIPGTPNPQAVALFSHSLSAPKAQPASSQGVTNCEVAEPTLMAK